MTTDDSATRTMHGEEVNTLPTHEDIARLAYAIWESQGGGDGHAQRDWLEAERQLLEVSDHAAFRVAT